MPSLTPLELTEARLRSGRLGGRPKKPTRAEARQVKLEQLVPKALIVLEESLESEDERVKLGAAREVFDRSWGRPVQGVRDETSAGDGLLAGLSADERARLLSSVAAKLRLIDGGKGAEDEAESA